MLASTTFLSTISGSEAYITPYDGKNLAEVKGMEHRYANISDEVLKMIQKSEKEIADLGSSVILLAFERDK